MRKEYTMFTATKKAFTLIELLVVIAIIAILAGILFPVFASARERGYQTACMSNMKQLGTALTSYLQDYDEAFPLNRFPWAGHAFPSALEGAPYTWKQALASLAPGKDIFKCPSSPEREQLDESAANIPNTEAAKRTPRSYAYNGAYFHEYAYGRLGRPAQLGKLKDPSGTILILESRDKMPDLGPWATWSYYKDTRKGMFNVHRGMMNVVFADTHAKSIKLQKAYSDDYFKDPRPEYQGTNLNTLGTNLVKTYAEYK